MKNYEIFKQQYHLNLNQQQQKAMVRINGQSLLLAVPGSGKTTVIICRIAYLLQVEKIMPEAILTLTFSRMGARDLKNRYQKLFGAAQAERLQFSTIHSFALSVIRHYERTYRRQAYGVLGNTTPVIRELYQHLFKAYPGEIELAEICQRIGFCKNMLMSDDEIKRLPPLEIDFLKLYEAYEGHKLDEQLMDFDDILKYAWVLLKKYPDMLAYFQNKYPYIHLDEAQDTSKIQFKIIELLTGKNGNLFMVGDEDQSIYGFRGAFPESLLSFKETWPQGEVLLMETNYRSTKQIVEKANAFIKLNHERYQKEMSTPNGSGVSIVREWVKSTEAQYQFIIKAIKQEGKEIAILYRNNESAIPLVDLLDEAGIGYHIKEHSPLFFTHFLIKDIKRFYQFACDPSDLNLFTQIYYKLDAAISRETINQMSKWYRSGDLVLDGLIKKSAGKDWQINRLKELKSGFQRLKNVNPKIGIAMILDDLGYRSYLNFRINSGQSEESIEQKLSMLKILAGRVPDFWRFFDKLTKLEEKLQEPQAKQTKNPLVTLSTFHSSKGLEFEKVFIIDATEGQIPNVSTAPEDHKAYAEEVRLFYVAVTRAKMELIFLCVKNREKDIKPSPFITYLIDGLPKKKRQTSKPSFKTKIKESFGSQQNKWQNYKTSELKMDLSAYQKGTLIAHQRFGEGTILERDGMIATIHFDQVGEKKMNLAVCIENGVIK
ncbi:ATP-dependent helicase [Acetobacterium woodii]|uniref:DNA 3'-5' helicase n=1 Tax=Acetobacterium woodii (strain ATCC 29683 / DSM 1030 / JCM 2381 / KCTC 1655 / WB1) TaxID=931626 RepID=H6LJM6_ACEWD|nr:ATP-dependent helicase [Acetobacterium woodii]AFA47427.1 ATP-dependent DNA helicase PcrA2 [Acetobacterium woodii DSM 1030]